MTEIINRRDLDFILDEVLNIESILKAKRYALHDRESVNAIVDLAVGIARDYYLPCAEKLDIHEPQFDGKKVSIIPEVAEALKAYSDAGFFASSFSEDVGGLQFPDIVNTVVNGVFSCANIGISPLTYLTTAAARLINICASEEQREQYLPPMLEGRWFGTMCLSEPHAGSSLSDINTKAIRQQDGSYRLTGSKMWITGGDQEISENIIHLVLAKIPGGPPGVKGISLFIVPKYLTDEQGNLGLRNDVHVAGLNHKMGNRGAPNAFLKFGENDNCTGYLIGEEHAGLSYMFHMMNEARIEVGCNATMSGLAGYLYSLQYARERPQGRLPDNRDVGSPNVLIIEHPDVKRMLLSQKANVEGAYHLVLYCAYLVDLSKITTSSEEKRRLNMLLELLTPIAKSWPSEFCLEANKHAIQILGGYGYTREYPVERYYRDNRLNSIHEGAHGIHGIDILGRKVMMNGGEALDAFIDEVRATMVDASEYASLDNLVVSLSRALELVTQTTDEVRKCKDRTQALANATLYLDAVGHIVIAWLWLQQAIVASANLNKAEAEQLAFYEGKIAACQFFFSHELPLAIQKLEIVKKLEKVTVDFTQHMFTGS